MTALKLRIAKFVKELAYAPTVRERNVLPVPSVVAQRYALPVMVQADTLAAVVKVQGSAPIVMVTEPKSVTDAKV